MKEQKGSPGRTAGMKASATLEHTGGWGQPKEGNTPHLVSSKPILHHCRTL